MRHWLVNARTVVVFTVAYFIVDMALNRFFNDGWNIVWPLNGVNIALLLMRPRSQWIWVLLGIELGTGFGERVDDNPLGTVVNMRLCSALEVLISASVLPAFTDLDRWLRTPRIFQRFFAALLLGPGISGLIAAAIAHVGQGQAYLSAFNDWATADALGVAATMPLALSLRSPEMRNLFARSALPRTLGIQTLALCGAVLIFTVSRYPLVFLLYPLLLLVDSLLAFAGSAIAVLGVCLISVYCTIHSLGPFGQWPDDLAVPRNLALQIYFGFHLVALFPASIMFMERRRLAAELHFTNARLTVLASLDGLTGIANRRSFDERFSQEWSRAIRQRNSVAVALIDLDNFKQYNDLYGHVAGDRCLCAVAQALAAQIQRPEDLVARYGGEEFALLLPDTSAAGAAKVGERIRAAICELALDHLGNSWNRVTVSIGYCSMTPVAGDGQAGLVQLADAALYQAKSAGRNRVETIASIEGLQAANDHGATSKNRLLRMLGRDR